MRPFTVEAATFRARELPIRDAIRPLGLNGMLNLAFSYQGQPGALLLATGSVDRSGTYVFAREPHAVGPCSGKSAVYWRTDDGFDTMYSFWNPKEEAQDLTLTFHYGEAQSYVFPVHLDGNASAMIDVRQLMEMRTRDARGNVLPPSATEGSLSVSASSGKTDPINIVMNTGIYNPATATCGTISETCDGCTSFNVSPNPYNTYSGRANQQMTFGCTWTDGSSVGGFSNVTWSSANTSIVTVNSTSGVATPGSAGSTTISASAPNLPVSLGTFQTSQWIPCPTQTGSASSNVTVTCAVPTNFRQTSASCSSSTGKQLHVYVVIVFGQYRRSF